MKSGEKQRNSLIFGGNRRYAARTCYFDPSAGERGRRGEERRESAQVAPGLLPTGLQRRACRGGISFRPCSVLEYFGCDSNLVVPRHQGSLART